MGSMLKRIPLARSGGEIDDLTHRTLIRVVLTVTTILASFSSLALSFRWAPEIDITPAPTLPTCIGNSAVDPSSGSLVKLRKHLLPGQEEHFNRSQPIYVDIGLNDGKDTALYLSKGFSVVSVDAYPAWVEKAKEEHPQEIAEGKLLAFNIGLATEEADSMRLYYKQKDSVIASLVEEKGCQGLRAGHPKCKHTDIEVVRCESLLQLIDTAVDIIKIDIEMLHQACVRGISRLETRLLPKQVCWEEHDKPFGPRRVIRPITDVKLILGLYENGYDQVKVVMQGPKAGRYYGLASGTAGHDSGSRTLLSDEMMHYRSHEYSKNGKFDTKWVSVQQVFKEGMFGPAKHSKPHFFNRNTYFGVCMKLNPDVERIRPLQDPDSFPLSSYAIN